MDESKEKTPSSEEKQTEENPNVKTPEQDDIKIYENFQDKMLSLSDRTIQALNSLIKITEEVKSELEQKDKKDD
ncbi:MAG: hypothetical protein AAB730_02245 [Patescibacteria group bacterium]